MEHIKTTFGKLCEYARLRPGANRQCQSLCRRQLKDFEVLAKFVEGYDERSLIDLSMTLERRIANGNAERVRMLVGGQIHVTAFQYWPVEFRMCCTRALAWAIVEKFGQDLGGVSGVESFERMFGKRFAERVLGW